MPGYGLIIGDKHLSSWSLRAWLLLRQFGLPFTEHLIHLDQDDTRQNILQFSPAAQVPILQADGQTVWDSLAIIEFIAEQHPDLAIWPRDAIQRAQARVMAAEMHGGFAALREDLPFELQRVASHVEIRPEVQADIDRICEIWRQGRRRIGAGGDFLFGGFGAVDAMYAPVAVRFKLYDVAVDDVCQAYMAALLSLPALADWLTEAEAVFPPSG
jgi:glutathione S-transferase